MDKYATTLHALLTGIGSAFVLVPPPAAPAQRASVETRVFNNFARVGARLESAYQPERGRHE